MENKLKEIKVLTLPNGYSLTVGRERYMYFNENDLLEGFLYHVGLEETKAVDKNTMRSMLDGILEVQMRKEQERKEAEEKKAAEDNEKKTE